MLRNFGGGVSGISKSNDRKIFLVVCGRVFIRFGVPTKVIRKGGRPC